MLEKDYISELNTKIKTLIESKYEHFHNDFHTYFSKLMRFRGKVQSYQTVISNQGVLLSLVKYQVRRKVKSKTQDISFAIISNLSVKRLMTL